MRKSFVFLIAFFMILCVSCSSDGEKEEIETDVKNNIVNNSDLTENVEKNDNDENIPVASQSAYDGLPEVTVPEISFDDIPFRTFEEFMAQDENDDTPYECAWEITEDVSDVPEENIILWAAMGSDYMASETAVNEQLKKDGYPFRMKIVTIPDEIYSRVVENCDADIIYTGDYYEGDVYSPAYKVVYGEKGKYLQLDKYLEGSRLWDHCPEVDWESVEYEGAHYVVPNYALSGESGLQIRIKKSAYSEEELVGFDGTLDSILPLVSRERKLFLGLSDFTWLAYEGIDYIGGGMYYDEEGNIANVMDLEINIRWMRELNWMLRTGRAFESASAEEDANEWTIALTDISDKNRFNEDDYYIYTFQGVSNSFYDCSLAIRSTSKNPEMAFQLMELIITDHTYANLMAYGGEGWVEQDGYMIDPVTKEHKGAGSRRYYFGIMDNAGRSEYCRWSFDTAEDRKEYVSKYVKKIEYKDVEYPALLYLLQPVKGEYTRIVTMALHEDDFNQKLAEYIAKSRQVFKILEEYQ